MNKKVKPLEIYILTRNQFLNMEKCELIYMSNIYFENQLVDDIFCEKWFNVGIDDGVYTLSFKDCEFDDYSFYIFDHYCVTNLKFDNCDITADNVDDILTVSAYTINSIDLSNNHLGLEEERLMEIFIDRLTNSTYSMDLILNNNNFSEYFKKTIKDCEYFDEGVNFFF